MAASDMPEQPVPSDFNFDLDQVLAAIVGIKTQIPDDALTASILGTERAGHGVLIEGNGIILTIGYLITEAETVWIVLNDGHAVPGYALAYDQETGFGIVQALQKLDLPAMALGSSEALSVGEQVVVAGHGGLENAAKARVIAKQEFAGYWEYLLDEAIFTAPAHPNWGGTALIADDGTLRGIGSLMVQDSANTPGSNGNMMIPIDLLKPIYTDLIQMGRSKRPPRPWLGMMTTEVKGALVVVGVSDDGPADQADVRVGDLILEVAGESVTDLADMFRLIWSLGKAGVEVPLKLMRNQTTIDLTVQSVNRYDVLKSPHLH